LQAEAGAISGVASDSFLLFQNPAFTCNIHETPARPGNFLPVPAWTALAYYSMRIFFSSLPVLTGAPPEKGLQAHPPHAPAIVRFPVVTHPSSGHPERYLSFRMVCGHSCRQAPG